ncbi:hypothetical protein GOB86_09280 [Acetobacter lambici]|uniref:Uncharacterized protein n=1 Tax=Acetobacter lambici TaxID=1332824 RepID=A0ABT1F1I7_9PROT|nr:hypothetical protein [Acetobacter lambici]MCP1242886.1 hypothetical protein [Acetobacter lambici]MCP1259056.1 hypothetical protein [Acetobacter lambici]NHO57249.1 hypothetical protein [Acetobacter lambici]
MAVPFLAATAHAEAYLHADAALLVAFNQFQDCRKRIDAHCLAKNHVFGTPEERLHEDKLNALVVEQDELVAAMAAIPATTKAGQQAKAIAALTMLRDQIAPGEEELGDSMTWLEVSLLTDLTREAAA